MPGDSSIQTFKCPACGAPLEAEAGETQMKCAYCNETVIIPQSLRKSLAPSTADFDQPAVFPTSHPSPSNFTGETYSAGRRRQSPSLIRGLIVVVVLCVVLGAVGYFAFGFNPLGSVLFANQVMSFGSKGIGQGMFQKAISVGVDGNGNIVVADHDDGRVQVFDPNGKFKSIFTVNNNGKPAMIRNIAVSRDGKIYINGSMILAYDENGQLLGQIGDGNNNYQAVALGADGTLYGFSEEENLVRFKKDGSIDLVIPNAVSNITGKSAGFAYLAVDGLGNMFILDNDAKAVFKYSPAGRFINQFGSGIQDISQFEAGKLQSPDAIAVDGYGRIFVNDLGDVQVFDSAGTYLTYFSGNYYGMAFDNQNNLYEIPVGGDNVVKLQIQKPNQQ